MHVGKTAAALLTFAALTALPGLCAAAEELQTGWVTEGKRISYLQEDGTPACGETEIDGTPYLFAPNGVLQTGWQTVGGVRRFYSREGEALTGWVEWRGERYYIDPDAGKLTGDAEIDGESYSLAADGTLQHDVWTESDGTWIYRGSDGTPAEGETVIDSVPYLFEAGIAQTGWQTAADGIVRYYEPAQPAEPPLPQTAEGWLDLPEGRFYADASRGRLTGLQEIDGVTYGFDETGALLTGLQFTADAWRMFSDDGALLTGWQETEQGLRYFTADGVMAQGRTEIGGAWFCFAEDGALQTGFIKDADGTRCFAENGTMLKGWQEIGADTFYFDAAGIMAVGTLVIDGKECCFTEDGVYQRPVRICLDAGHYGKYNQSPVNPVYYESDFNWKLHLYLKEELESYGIEVITTRPDQDTDLDLEERGKTSEGCDLFLSLHSNACEIPSCDGPLACCAINGSADEIGYALADCVRNVMQTNGAASIWKREGIRGDWYGVLRGATKVGTPAVLLEHSYHTNLRATNWLLVDSNVRRLAKAEAALLAEWFGVTERRETT